MSSSICRSLSLASAASLALRSSVLCFLAMSGMRATGRSVQCLAGPFQDGKHGEIAFSVGSFFARDDVIQGCHEHGLATYRLQGCPLSQALT